MTKISSVRRCLRLPRNARGRDFVVGDLHGHRALLEQSLDRLGFDPRRDRVLSVGDLIDRGPESLATLALIEEPWFHAVLGNHELMLLHGLDYYASRLHSKKSSLAHGAAWIGEANSRKRRLLERLADRVAELPLAIHVDGDIPFNVTHADLHAIGSTQEGLLRERTICIHKADIVTSSRQNIADGLKSSLLLLQYEQHAVEVSTTPLGELPITYVGHSPQPHVTVHKSYIHIDQGVCTRSSKRAVGTMPTVLEHGRFALWLGGVATARGRPDGGHRVVAHDEASVRVDVALLA